MLKVWFYPCWDLDCFFHNNEQCFLYVQVQVKIWRDYAHPRQLFQMIQILLYVFLFLSESIRIWLRIERSITETYTHTWDVYFFTCCVCEICFVGEYPLREITRMWISIPNIFRLFKSFTDGSRVMCISIEWSMQTIKVLSAYPEVNRAHVILLIMQIGLKWYYQKSMAWNLSF